MSAENVREVSGKRETPNEIHIICTIFVCFGSEHMLVICHTIFELAAVNKSNDL